MNKLNLIIDGSYFFYKSLFTTSKFKNNKFNVILDNEESSDIFVRKFITDLCFILRSMPNHHRIIFTNDSRSWRKNIKIHGNGYKSNREDKGTSVNWDNFYNLCNEITKILEDKNFIIAKQEGAEADDLIYLYSKYFHQNGDDCIILTGDQDLYQCISQTKNSEVFVFNPNSKNRKFACVKNRIESIKENDIFSIDNIFKENLYEKLLTLTKDVEEIDVNDFIVKKILKGDLGDGVPPVIEWQTITKKGITNNSLTDNKIEKILLDTKLNITPYNILDENILDTLAKSILKITGQKQDLDIIKKKIETNRKVLWLNEMVIPEEIIKQFLDNFNKIQNKYVQKIDYKIHSFLNSTKYSNLTDTQLFDMFKNL